LNIFRMLSLMGEERIHAESSGALGLDSVLSSGARSVPDINALATRDDRRLTILVWNYEDDDTPSAQAIIDMSVRGIRSPTHQVLLEHYRIDQTTSNAYTAWKEMGSPQNPSDDQHARLKAAGQLELVTSPQRLKVTEDTLRINFKLPSQAVSLVQLSW
jgi:xylan 1,4-beta-xylosidase